MDASWHRSGWAGVARYLDSMVGQMMTIEPDWEFVFYAPGSVTVSLPPGRWRLRTDRGKLTWPVNLWAQTRFPVLAAEDKLDVFWGQNNVLPLRLNRPCFRLLTVHDLAPLVCPGTLRLKSALIRKYYLARACRVADAVVSVSDATTKSAVSRLGVRRERVTTIYEGVSDRFRPVPEGNARALLAQRYGLRGDYLLTVGTIEPRKQHLALLRALRLVPSPPPLVVVGGVGWKATRIVREIAAMEAAGRVRYMGRVDDSYLPAIYSAAKLFVFPSQYEGFGLPVLEAMACGCPVLCSWSSSLPEVGGDAVRYFRTGDSADLARALVRLLADEGQLATMVVSGLSRAASFSFQKAAAQVINIIKEGVKVSDGARRAAPCA